MLCLLCNSVVQALTKRHQKSTAVMFKQFLQYEVLIFLIKIDVSLVSKFLYVYVDVFAFTCYRQYGFSLSRIIYLVIGT